MVTSAGFVSVWEKLSCEFYFIELIGVNWSQMPLGLGWEHLARGTGCAEARCCLFCVCELSRNFRKVYGISQDRPFIWICHWKGLSGLGWPASWVRQGLRESSRQIDGDSDIKRKRKKTKIERDRSSSTCSLSAGKTQQRKNGFHQQFCPSSPCPKTRQFNYSQYVPGALWATTPVLELRVSEYE